MRIRDTESGKTYFRKVRRSGSASELGYAYELTFSCYHRYQFLSRDRTREWFIKALADARHKLAFDLWAYVIMPDHVHVLVYPRNDEATVSRIRSAIKEPVARKAIQYMELNAPHWLPKITVREGTRLRRRFWQPGGGYDRTGVEIETIHAMIDYIHANPVRRGLAASTTDWEWSSAGWYANQQPVRIEMDRTLPIRMDL